jgi:hypothetical protein
MNRVQGVFEVSLQPQPDPEHPAGRMLLDKRYMGELDGLAIGQMISRRCEGGESVYAAVEVFSGQLAGRVGGFTLFHVGSMSEEGQSLEVRIVSGSGSGDLAGIRGDMQILIDGGEHRYVLDYSLD